MSCIDVKNKVTRGNDFFMSLQLAVETASGLVPFDFTACDSYTARAYVRNIGSQETLSDFVGLADGTTDTVIIDVAGAPLNSLVVVEITGVHDGRAFRAAERGLLSIVEYNDQARIVFTPINGSRGSGLSMTVKFLPSAAVVGKNAYEIWKEEPGNEDKTLDDFIYFLGHGESAYEIAVRYGYEGTEAEYSALYFDAVTAANGAAQSANGAAQAANGAAQAANGAAAQVALRIDTIDTQMSYLCYHEIAGGTSEPASFDPEADTVHIAAQTLSSAQQQQVRANIGAAGVNDVVGMPVVNHGTGDTTFSLTPNVFHVWGTVSTLTLSLATGEVGYVQEYMFEFTSGSTATTLTLPSTLKWINGVEPSSIEAGKTYQVSIMNGIGVIGGAE